MRKWLQRMADALLVRLPSGREIPLHDAPLPLGRSTSPPLCDHEAVSRTHVRLEPLEGGGDVMLLRLVSRNAVAVEVQAEGAGERGRVPGRQAQDVC